MTTRIALIGYIVLFLSALAVVFFVGNVVFKAWNLVPHVVFAFVVTATRSSSKQLLVAGVLIASIVAAWMFFGTGCGGGYLCKADGQSGLLFIFTPIWGLIGGGVLFGLSAAVIAIRRRRAA
jgi:hypothetical protein